MVTSTGTALGSPGIPQETINMINGIGRVMSLIGFIIFIIQAFKVKKILSAHFNLTLSGPATFFFNIFYLQQKIKRLNF